MDYSAELETVKCISTLRKVFRLQRYIHKIYVDLNIDNLSRYLNVARIIKRET